jgi:hypothetical protein
MSKRDFPAGIGLGNSRLKLPRACPLSASVAVPICKFGDGDLSTSTAVQVACNSFYDAPFGTRKQCRAPQADLTQSRAPGQAPFCLLKSGQCSSCCGFSVPLFCAFGALIFTVFSALMLQQGSAPFTETLFVPKSA